MYKNMLVSLVVAALVAVIMSINPNPAWAKSTPLATASADATSLDRRPAYNREDILALQVRTTAAEKEIARLEGLRASFRVACADVTDAACQADIQRLTRQIKALKAEIERVDADRAADRVRIDGEIARIDAARAADRQWVGEQIARIDTAMETAKKERQALGLRLDVLEAAWRPVFWGMGNIGMSARTPMSAYGVSRT
ncbi:hypothetical protein KJ673_00030, partial [Patescibacteria group bacterium]|nr:hypothetical protein [Patescibacteria group bacterium]